MKTIAALFLAGLLAVLGYGIFWMVSLNYTTAQMKGTLEQGLQARVSYGQPQWVPDAMHVTMDLPAVNVELGEGPVRKLAVPTLRLSSDFFRRDRWVMHLPPRVEVTLAQGGKLMLETVNGSVMWLKEGNNLTLKADSVRVLDLAGNERMSLQDVVMERGIYGGAVELNLASRPQWEGGSAVISGKMKVPSAVFASVVNLFGQSEIPTAASLVRTAVQALKPGDVVEIANLSVKKTANGRSDTGALFGKVTTTREMQWVGELTVSSDKADNLLQWVRQANVLAPRSPAEALSAKRFLRRVQAERTLRIANMQTTLTLNGEPVGPLPDIRDVMNRLWPL